MPLITIEVLAAVDLQCFSSSDVDLGCWQAMTLLADGDVGNNEEAHGLLNALYEQQNLPICSSMLVYSSGTQWL